MVHKLTKPEKKTDEINQNNGQQNTFQDYNLNTLK